MSNQLFTPGQIHATPGSVEACSLEQAHTLITRHLSGDFGTAGKYHEILPTITQEEWAEGAMATSDDGKLNVIAIRNNSGRVMSYYKVDNKDIWVSTDGLGTPDVYTTILLPGEY
jgi:hypothetical protein